MEKSGFKCIAEGCQKSYSNSFNLKRHVESFHKGIKKFFCTICNKGLSSKQNLREHSFIHLDIKPYVCTHNNCQAAFRQASQLTLHENMHNEVEKQLKLRAKGDYLKNDIFTKLITEANLDSQEEDILPESPSLKVILPEIKFEFSSCPSDKYW